jgi:CRISPR-associated protein Csd1
MVTGRYSRVAQNHPKFVRFPGDGAKLLSTNDSNGFTFRGRFSDQDGDYGKQAYSVSYEVTQKAHSALRWLIERQAYRDYESGQTIVAWAVAGKPVPDPWVDSLSLILGFEATALPASDNALPLIGDVGQSTATRLERAISGYGAKLDPTDDIVVMGLDSATPGRMAITFYRELKGSDFLGRIQAWHEQYAWHQNFSKEAKFVGAPAPRLQSRWSRSLGMGKDPRHRLRAVPGLLEITGKGIRNGTGRRSNQPGLSLRAFTGRRRQH